MSQMKYLLLGGLFAGLLAAFAQTPVPVPAPVPPVAPAKPALVFDAELKAYTAVAGDTNAYFSFFLTNTSTVEARVNSVRTSCGCTVAQLPSQPWVLAPGQGGPIKVTVDLRGKMGTITKTVTAETSDGPKALNVTVTMPPATESPAAFDVTNREGNQKMALGDRSAIFKGDCARCHVEPARGKLGKALYATACGICHDAEHRASAVADLQVPKTPRDVNYWQQWVAHGKAGTMMPGFAATDGGPLTKEQVDSLVVYLNETFPKAPKAN